MNETIDIAQIDDIDKLKSLAFDVEQQRKNIEHQYDLLINRINKIQQENTQKLLDELNAQVEEKPKKSKSSK